MLSPFEQKTTIGERMLRRSISCHRTFECSGRQLVSDEQLVYDELYFFGIEIDVTTPPLLETEIARPPSVSILE